jgi:predicted RNA binding protein YcfA (HicA-like mRNA interferase family)
MTRWEKLARDLCGPPIPPQASTKDLFALLEGAGWTFVRYSGRNYAIFASPTSELLNVPMVQGRHVKRAYIRRACQMLGLDDDTDSTD